VESLSECFKIGARNMLMYIGKGCIKCGVLIKTKPNDGRDSRPSPGTSTPFSHLGLDLFSPLEVWDEVRVQSTRYIHAYKKIWVAVVVCLGTHTAKLYLMWGYSPEDFMFMWECHKSDWGVPITVYTDKGM